MGKARPIIMAGESVRAILAGRKTQTRRVVTVRGGLGFIGARGEDDCPGAWGWLDDHGMAHTLDRSAPEGGTLRSEASRHARIPCPHGEPGDRLWVRETFARVWADADGPSDRDTIEYRADTNAKRPGGWDGAQREEVPPGARWRSPIHMPRWASRLTLEITSVRVERVRAITEGDARAEGVLMLDNIHPIASARDVFAELWDSINGKRPGCSWADNPWCWCLQFRRIDA